MRGDPVPSERRSGWRSFAGSSGADQLRSGDGWLRRVPAFVLAKSR